jgi:cation/acetate symporter
MVGLALSIAASRNFPILFMSMMWRGGTTRGVVIGGSLRLVSSLAGVILSPAVWVRRARPALGVVSLREPDAILNAARAFAGIGLFSKLDRSERAKMNLSGFDAQFVRAQTGIGASGLVSF